MTCDDRDTVSVKLVRQLIYERAASYSAIKDRTTDEREREIYAAKISTCARLLIDLDNYTSEAADNEL